MAKLKIISNPYRKEIRYQKWQEATENWVDIDYSNSKNVSVSRATHCRS